jgi:hypothetical protein
MPPPVLDQFGRVISEPPIDQWQARSGIAMAIEKIVPNHEESQVVPLFELFVNKALGDRHEDVRKHMLDGAVAAINSHGKVGHITEHEKIRKLQKTSTELSCFF